MATVGYCHQIWKASEVSDVSATREEAADDPESVTHKNNHLPPSLRHAMAVSQESPPGDCILLDSSVVIGV